MLSFKIFSFYVAFFFFIFNYIYMHDNGSKYVYIKDSFGELIGSCLTSSGCALPSTGDTIFIIAIAQKLKGCIEWDASVRNVDMGIRLQKSECVKLYDNHEQFCEEFFDAIL